MQKRIFFGFLILASLTSFSFGILVGRTTVEPKIIFGVINPEEGKSQEVDFSLFWRVWASIQEKFVDEEKFDYQVMLYGAISGMVNALDDPYTVFFNPEEAKKFKEDVSGKFEGVGMEVGIRKNELTVIAPLEGTPAQKAGLRAGDKIIKIGDTITGELTIDEAVSFIRGPKGTEVTLTIFREDWGIPREITLIREVIEIPSLKWELLASPGEAGGKEPDIAYIKLYHFHEKAGVDFKKAAFDILESPAKKIILDLRNNPGGYLEISQDIAGWFLERGQVVVIEDFGEGKEKKDYKAGGNELFLEYPMVILINQGSASASEILAAALRDNRGIKIIGETSFGKGSVQELEDLPEGSSLKVTIAKWLTPKGDILTDVGLEPDIKIDMTEKDYEEEKDPQLEKAIEIIEQL
ncbi:MAG TPA: S41 family peptidase [Candidatus Nealsonbacteria bacterium]|uniref:PDZ domain-containing protein n=1 Tax=marine sediment metagenome TaxID=412755 RepID=A0A0F9YEC9_9ZZZZ|nr:S41 family peptidase [Candidatus Nealsonbacteria bacterium]HEB46498.1 S41 family peptidase [Candidatus Nealsonbacteria bacterium]